MTLVLRLALAHPQPAGTALHHRRGGVGVLTRDRQNEPDNQVLLQFLVVS
jgi:hypothetical protein